MLLPFDSVADSKPQLHVTTLCKLNGRCYCQGGRWNSHLWVGLTEQLADIVPIVADGIATEGSVLFQFEF